jgi:hypothetical protein
MPSHFVVLLFLASLAQPPGREDSRYHQTIERVLTLLPNRPAQVVIVDPDQAGADLRGTLLRMEAFITKGGRVVYLTSHGEALRGALKGWSLHEYILASIIWHEMAHIDGADEMEAQRREEALWIRYVMDERVDPGDGMRYLSALKSRRSKDTRVQPGDAVLSLNGPLMPAAIAVIELHPHWTPNTRAREPTGVERNGRR